MIAHAGSAERECRVLAQDLTEVADRFTEHIKGASGPVRALDVGAIGKELLFVYVRLRELIGMLGLSSIQEGE